VITLKLRFDILIAVYIKTGLPGCDAT